MKDKINCLHEQVAGLRPRDTLLVGVSGGSDSICLLHLLTKNSDYKIIAAHLDHQLRPESSLDAGKVQHLAEGFGLGFVLGTEDVAAHAQEYHTSIEEAGRELRYQFLFSVAALHNAKAVVVGHHADDQVETVLMHFLRGTGLAGLTGMQFSSLTSWHPTIPLVRPLLSISRREIEAYCEAHGLFTLEDSSNEDPAFFRNRLRSELIPYLETFNPNIRKLIFQMADSLQADYAVLSTQVEEIYRECLVDSGEQHISLNRKLFSSQPLGIQRNLVRHAVRHLRPGLRDFGFKDTARVLDMLNSPPQSRQADLTAGLRMRIDAERMIFADWKAELLDPDWPQWGGGEQPIAIPGITKLGNNWQIEAVILETDPHPQETTREESDPFTAYFAVDPQRVIFAILTRQPGVRISPFGMDGSSQKVGDLMTNAKLPPPAREGWPLLAVGGEVVWVPGIRRSGLYLVEDNSSFILRISFERTPADGN